MLKFLFVLAIGQLPYSQILYTLVRLSLSSNYRTWNGIGEVSKVSEQSPQYFEEHLHGKKEFPGARVHVILLPVDLRMGEKCKNIMVYVAFRK